jgi:PleD family two-component response regulator
MTVPATLQVEAATVTPARVLEPPALPAHAPTTVVVVDGGEHVLDLLESVFGAGPFDIVVVESSRHAYSRIRQAQPALVIVSVRFADAMGFQLLSMLAADDATRRIPILMCAAGDEPEPSSHTAPEEAAML